jgi:hypothetical protein
MTIETRSDPGRKQDMTEARDDIECDRPGDRESIERKLVRALWEWSATPAPDTDAQASAVAAVAGWIEAFLSGVFRESNSPGAQSWWSDGVVKLSLTQRSPTAIEAVGATIWAEHGPDFYLAPFEVEFYFASPNDAECVRIIVHFGKLDHLGKIIRLPYDNTAELVIQSRPKNDSDWALAVEIS